MKQIARQFVKRLAHRIPVRIRNAILEQFCEDLSPWDVLRRVAPRCGILSVKVAGAYGTVQSVATDDTILRVYAETGYWARRTNQLLCTFFRDRPGHYIDIGANIGLTTIPVAQNPQVHCLAIEPEPTNFRNLEVNVAANCPHHNVELRQVAIFSRHDTLKFEIAASGNLGDHRLRLQDRPGRWGEHSWSTISVEAAPLDDVVGATARPLAVKIDTQGAEPFVVEGGSRTLAAADLLICEWWPYSMARMNGDPSAVTKMLREHFRVINISTGEDGSVSNGEPTAVATERLLNMAHRYRADPLQYFEIVSRK